MKRRDLIAVIELADIAMQDVIDCWEHGDLAAAMRRLVVAKMETAAVLGWESDNA